MRISEFPNVLEVEPNNEIAKSTPTNLEPPFALNGIIEEKGDVDFFKFSAKKGQPLDVAVFARRLRSPLDSVIDIYDAKGNRLAGTTTAVPRTAMCAGRLRRTANFTWQFATSFRAVARPILTASRSLPYNHESARGCLRWTQNKTRIGGRS